MIAKEWWLYHIPYIIHFCRRSHLWMVYFMIGIHFTEYYCKKERIFIPLEWLVREITSCIQSGAIVVSEGQFLTFLESNFRTSGPFNNRWWNTVKVLVAAGKRFLKLLVKRCIPYASSIWHNLSLCSNPNWFFNYWSVYSTFTSRYRQHFVINHVIRANIQT